MLDLEVTHDGNRAGQSVGMKMKIFSLRFAQDPGDTVRVLSDRRCDSVTHAPCLAVQICLLLCGRRAVGSLRRQSFHK